MTEADRPSSPFRPRRLLAVLAAGVLFSGVGALWVQSGDSSAKAEASDRPLLTPEPIVTTSIVTLPPETTAPPASTGQRSAVAVPKNKYAPEPIVHIGTLEIPKIGLVTPIYHGITMRNIDLGPSHWPGTPFPGEIGNSVFPGHRVTKTHPFRNIDKMAPGDQMIFTVNGVRSVYVMTHSLIVKPTQMEIVNQTAEPTVTIFGCHPPGSARFRYVVKGTLVQA
jgi:sortase A